MTNIELQALLKELPDDLPVAIMTDFMIAQSIKVIEVASSMSAEISEFEDTIILDYFNRPGPRLNTRAFIHTKD